MCCAKTSSFFVLWIARVTIGARRTQRLVTNIGCAVVCYGRKMAKVAGNVVMRSIKRPCRVAIVIKQELLPSDRSVTTLASGYLVAFHQKLTRMGILVAESALLRKGRHAN